MVMERALQRWGPQSRKNKDISYFIIAIQTHIIRSLFKMLHEYVTRSSHKPLFFGVRHRHESVRVGWNKKK